MSVKIMGRVWDLDLPPAHKYVLLAMTDHADHNGENMYPGTGLIAHKTGYSVRQVQRIIDDLVQQGILEETIEPGQKSVFRADLNAVPTLSKYDPRRKKYARGDKMSSQGVTKCHPSGGDKMSSQGVTSATHGGDICDTEGVTSAHEKKGGVSASESPKVPRSTRTNRPWNHHEPPPPPPHTDSIEGGGGGSWVSTEDEPNETLAVGEKNKAAGPGRNGMTVTETERWLAAEGMGEAHKWRDLPLAAVQQDVARRRALGQGWGAISKAWDVAPPGAAPPPPVPRPVPRQETTEEAEARIQRIALRYPQRGT